MGNVPRLNVSKVDAARRQIETAINLYFSSLDPVSIHTLASAAYNVLNDLCASRNVVINHFRKQFLDRVKPEYETEVFNKLRKAENFFKHADKDPEDSFSLNPEATEFVLFDSVELYIGLTSEVPPLLGMYRAWWQGRNRHLFIDKASSEYRIYEENADLLQNRRLFYNTVFAAFNTIVGS